MVASPDITKALKQIADRKVRYETAANYYNGDQPLAFATSKFLNVSGRLFEAFADNLCQMVVDALTDRLQLTGFGIEDGDEEAATAADVIWQRNRMDQRAGTVHLEAARTGDSYLVVWPDAAGLPRLYPQKALEMTVGYDEEDPTRLAWAAKLWRQSDGRDRLTLYYPDRIEKYIGRSAARASAFQRYEVAGEDWPLANPWGVVPVFHFANNADVGSFGQSELYNVYPLQDALNKAIADLLVSMEFVSFPQRWATGIEVDVDPTTGEAINVPFRPGVDRVWTVASETARFGEFGQADLEKFLKVQDSFRFAIARVSGTPMHYMQLISDPPSGEALKTLEARFVKKVKDRQGAFGNIWEDAMALALRMVSEAWGDLRLSTKWVEAAPTSIADKMSELTTKKELGVPQRQLLIEAGYGEAEVDAWLAEAQATAGAQAQPALPGTPEQAVTAVLSRPTAPDANDVTTRRAARIDSAAAGFERELSRVLGRQFTRAAQLLGGAR